MRQPEISDVPFGLARSHPRVHVGRRCSEKRVALSRAYARACPVKSGEKHAKLAVNNRARSVAIATPRAAAMSSLRSSFRLLVLHDFTYPCSFMSYAHMRPDTCMHGSSVNHVAEDRGMSGSALLFSQEICVARI